MQSPATIPRQQLTSLNAERHDNNKSINVPANALETFFQLSVFGNVHEYHTVTPSTLIFSPTPQFSGKLVRQTGFKINDTIYENVVESEFVVFFTTLQILVKGVCQGLQTISQIETIVICSGDWQSKFNL